MEPTDINVEWFNQHVAPGISSCNASTVSISEGSAGRGFTTSVSRVEIEWEAAGADLPVSVIVKLALPSQLASPVYRQAIENERQWYLGGITRLPVTIPRCYASHFDVEEGSYYLVLEDLRDMRVIDPEDGLNRVDAHCAVETMARIHAHTPDVSHLNDHSDGLPAGLGNCLRDNWELIPQFCEIDFPELTSTAEALERQVKAAASAIRSGPRTLVHGDYKVDNLLFDDETGDVVVLDWQGVARGWAVEELAEFLSRSLADGVPVKPLLEVYAVDASGKDDLFKLFTGAYLMGLANHVLALDKIASGQWSDGDEARQARMEDYARLILTRKVRVLTEFLHS